ncbi:hypothetical protein Hanom_Chr04g00332951 [Helianthus anomalus]
MQTGSITSMATTWAMVSTPSIRLLLKRFLKLSMKKESILKKYKSLRERTSRGDLGFYSNDGILSEILDDGKAICQNYIPEDLVELPQATTEERLANAQLLRSREIHNTLKADLVEHAWAIRPIRLNNDHDEDSEEEVGEEFEDGNFEDVGLDAGENEEEEGENEDDTEE